MTEKQNGVPSSYFTLTWGFFLFTSQLWSPALIIQPNAVFSLEKSNNKILKHSLADTSTP